MSDSIIFAAVIEAARELTQERDKFRKQLNIATEALKKIKMETGNGFHMQVFSISNIALAEIEKIKS